MEASAVLRELAAEMSEPVGAGYTVSPDGRRVAVRHWPAYPPRPQAPVMLLHYGALVYDVARRAVARRAPRIGRLAVYDTSTGERLAEGPDLVAGPPVWGPDGRLAGLAPMLDGEGYSVWVLDIDGGARRELDSLRVGCSLLGLPTGRRGPGPATANRTPLWWARDGRLVVARDAIDRDAIDPRTDIVAEPESGDPHAEPTYHHDLLAIAAAARVELVVVDAETGRPDWVLRSGCVLADGQISPAGDRLLAGLASDPHDVAGLIAGGVAGYEVRRIERGDRGRSLGDWVIGTVCWRPRRDGEVVAARPAGDGMVLRTLTAEAAAGDGSVELAMPIAAWLAPGAGGVVAITEVARGTATGAGRQLVAAGVAGVFTVDSAADEGPGWLRAVPARGQSDREAVVGFGGLGRGERVLVLSPDDPSGPVRELLTPAGPTDRVIFVDGWSALVERHDAAGSALVRRRLGETRDDEQVLHRLRAPAPAFSRTDRETGGQLDAWTGYHLHVPPRCRGATLVELRILPADAARPWIAPGRLPPSARAHLATGTAVAILYLRWPAGDAPTFADIRCRLTGAVTALCSRLADDDGVDPDRLALAGHSFGAACAGVVLAHTPKVFRCAILRAGAYNRTLTPRGFQDERRDLWRARDVYDGFTLAYYATEIDCPVLILQGTADTNGVTDALQAWAFYDTLLACGRHARIVLLYNEDHAITTREGLLTALGEELAWMRRWTGPAGSD